MDLLTSKIKPMYFKYLAAAFGSALISSIYGAVDMAMAGVSIGAVHGINGKTPEDTMRYMGMIASPGMIQTEKTIVEIMEQKQ